MEPVDLQPFVDWVLDELEPSCRVEPGHYARAPGGEGHDMYGTADMACILWSLDAVVEHDLDAWQAGKPADGDIDQIGGTFRYANVFAHANRPLRFADRRIDTVLGLQRADGIRDRFNPMWLTLDAVDLLAGPLLVHSVTAVVTLVAEFQDHFGPDVVVTERPVRNVLRARPFL